VLLERGDEKGEEADASVGGYGDESWFLTEVEGQDVRGTELWPPSVSTRSSTSR
jgi:hypothetical protein